MDYFNLVVVVYCMAVAATLAGQAQAVVPSPSSLNSGLRFLYQNDLDWNKASSSSRQAGYLLLTTPLTASLAAQRCADLGESLVSSSASSHSGLQAQLSYLVYDGSYSVGQSFWAESQTAFVISSNSSSDNLKTANPDAGTMYPVLCTQSAPWNVVNATETSSSWQVSTSSNGVQYTGYRDALSFRFLAVPYANPTQRFSYSTVFDPTIAGSSSISALRTGRNLQCPQNDAFYTEYTEQCLLTDIFTPYLPSSMQVSTEENLKPVFVFIHGGGYNSGTGLDFTFDGGNMASRSDVVVLTVNYRLGSLGYLTYNDQIRGNYGLSDLVTVLQWIQKYIKAFGGDPNKVTIGGQSAGAQHVENLLASPAASGLFHRAIVFSGKGHDSAFVYPSVQEAQAGRGGQVVKALGCDTASDVLACLRALPVSAFLKNSYNIISRDGTYIASPRLDMRKPDSAQGHVNRVPVIWGTMRDELAALGIVPPASEQNLQNALKAAGIASNYSQIVLNNPTVFSTEEYGVQNLTVTVNTDISYRCGIQAMAYASAVNQVFPSVWAYFYDQRSYQIPNYDPNNVCKPTDGNLSPSSYYMCHSGDLMTIFHTAGIGFGLPYRDSDDLPWMASIIDQFSAFIRTGNPSPSTNYLLARGGAYASTLRRTTSSSTRWASLTSSDQRGLSFGPEQQRMIPVGQKNDQCASLGKGLDYIANL